MKRLLLPRLFAAFALTTPAALGHGDRGFPIFPFPPCGPSIRIGTPRFSIEFGACRPRHVHRFSYVCEREWVAPLYETRVVGYDCRGRPIRLLVLVRAGSWTTVRYRVCDCGMRSRC
jgi:hypothetical protein